MYAAVGYIRKTSPVGGVFCQIKKYQTQKLKLELMHCSKLAALFVGKYTIESTVGVHIIVGEQQNLL